MGKLTKKWLTDVAHRQLHPRGGCLELQKLEVLRKQDLESGQTKVIVGWLKTLLHQVMFTFGIMHAVFSRNAITGAYALIKSVAPLVRLKNGENRLPPHRMEGLRRWSCIIRSFTLAGLDFDRSLRCYSQTQSKNGIAEVMAFPPTLYCDE